MVHGYIRSSLKCCHVGRTTGTHAIRLGRRVDSDEDDIGLAYRFFNFTGER